MEKRSEIEQSEYIVQGNYARHSRVVEPSAQMSAENMSVFDAPVEEPKQKLGRGSWLFLGVCTVITLILTVGDLMIQYKDAEIIRATQVYEQQTADLNLQTTQLMDHITNQYNFEAIKEAAEANGLQMNESRVRNVGE